MTLGMSKTGCIRGDAGFIEPDSGIRELTKVGRFTLAGRGGR
jgi:hypothetical protein